MSFSFNSEDGGSSGSFAVVFVDMQPRKPIGNFLASEQHLQRQKKGLHIHWIKLRSLNIQLTQVY